ncbi:family 16 glycosylhydrolase [Flavobacterium sp. J372]|uniref:family 16 glycosylhydrolase n=1 Tax=Flavobacterium sp. J372 TaxID=2898436 RepID=UPI002151BC1F|nr:family 16 glycosylhydrolase [Flavobacterium sp. J372]MCR5863214.1 family 16 glycosylhydrolase [Flavobacterium sp. J372]
MKKIFLLLVLTGSYCYGQLTSSTPYTIPSDWGPPVFYDNFNNPTLDTQKWKAQNGENRWLQEQVFQPDEVTIKDNALVLSIDKNPDGFLNGSTKFKNGNGNVAKYSAGEVLSKQNFMYGYFEAKIKLPSGKGTFAAFWLFPNYREREIHPNSVGFGGFYPEEIDIIEQVSIEQEDPFDYNHTYSSHIYDVNMFWDNQASNKPYFFTSLGSCGDIGGSWHRYAVKWDIFKQEFFIDGELVYTIDLWNRNSHSESINLVLTNAIKTNTSDPTQNPEDNLDENDNIETDNTIINGKTVLFPDPDTNDIEDEKVQVDWVKVYQQKKYQNPVVWASGKSDKLGIFNLEKTWNKFDTFITGNFIPETNNDDDEILSFSSDGLNSALQRLTNRLTITTKDIRTNDQVINTYNDVWSVEKLEDEIPADEIISGYTLNNWFTPDALAHTNYAVGNFDGAAGDELFLSNKSTLYAVIIKFDPDQAPGNTYNYNELYVNSGNNQIDAISGTGSVTLPLHTDDKFIAGNFNGGANDNLLWINHSNNTIWLLTYNTTNSQWTRINSNNKLTTTTSTQWNLNSNDEYLAEDFDGDGKDELLCINKLTKKVRLYAYSANAWSLIWDNSTTAYPNKINEWVIGLGDDYLAGKFLGNGNQLLCTNRDGGYAHLYEFNVVNGIVQCKTKQLNEQPYKIPQQFRILKYNFADKGATPATVNLKTTLLSVERFMYPTWTKYDTVIPADKVPCKYHITLTSFNDLLSNTVFSRPANIEETVQNGTVLNEADVLIYPNPADNLLNIHLGEYTSGSYKIFDILGKEIEKAKFASTDNLLISLSPKMQEGTYSIKLNYGSRVITKKFIIKR